MYILKTSRIPLVDELDALLRKSLKLAMLSRGIKEEEVAQELSKQPGIKVTPAQITAWKAETRHRWRLPAALVPIICEILGNDSIQRLLLSEKLRQSLKFGESVPEIVALLRSALPEGPEQREVKCQKKPRRRSKA